MIRTIQYIDIPANEGVSIYEHFAKTLTAAADSVALRGLDARSVSNLARYLEQAQIEALKLSEELIDGIAPELTQSALSEAYEHLGTVAAEKHRTTSERNFSQSEIMLRGFVLSELSSAMTRNRAAVLREVRRLMIFGADDAIDPNVLRLTDAIGRRVPAAAQVRKVWRAALRDHAVIVYASVLSEAGETSMRLWNRDPSSASFGMTADPRLADFGIERLQDVLHPNSNTIPLHREKFEEMI